MVLESLFPVKSIIKHPRDMFIFSFIITIASIFLSNLIFPNASSSGTLIILFIAVGTTPIIYRLFVVEEDIERKEAEHKLTLTFKQRHAETIIIFSLFFLGNAAAIFLYALLMPDEFVVASFADQLIEISKLTTPIKGSLTSPGLLNTILSNNVRVMLLSFFLSFLIGTGALIILSWNASILALYLASFLKRGLIAEFAVRTISIIPHAPWEIGAYFLAGIAGGILSVGLIRERIGSREFVFVFRDAFLLLGFAFLAVFVGALIEVYV